MQGAGHRVAITGYGVVAPCGIGKELFWKGLLGPGFTGANSIEMDNWDPSPYFESPKESRRADRCEQFALAAAGEAMTQAGELPYNRERIGTILGTGIGGLRTLEGQVEVRMEKGERRVSPFLVPMMMSNASGATISMRYGLQGPTETVCTACAASTHAIGNAARLIAWGRCDAVVTGGTESAATVTALAGFTNMTAISSTFVSKPFDETRDGFIQGEGAAIFVLERLDLALARGATILGEIVGAASNADAYHITAPPEDGAGAGLAMRNALRDAAIDASAVRYLNAHATSTNLGDRAETVAIKRAFGDHAAKLAVSSTKSMTGHLLGAAGVIEAIFSVLAVRDQVAPPTINLHEPDAECDLDYVPNTARQMPIDVAMSNSFGFGGTNGTLIFSRFRG